MDDVIKLIKNTYAVDDYGNHIPTETETQVFCDVRTVTRSEYYLAAQADLMPQYVFRLSHYMDYHGEPFVKYTDWTGEEKLYHVIRVYRAQDSDALELTVEERAGDDTDESE